MGKKIKARIAEREVRLKRLEELYKMAVKNQENPDIKTALKTLNQAAQETGGTDKMTKERDNADTKDEVWVATIEKGHIKTTRSES